MTKKLIFKRVSIIIYFMTALCLYIYYYYYYHQCWQLTQWISADGANLLLQKCIFMTVGFRDAVLHQFEIV